MEDVQLLHRRDHSRRYPLSSLSPIGALTACEHNPASGIERPSINRW